MQYFCCKIYFLFISFGIATFKKIFNLYYADIYLPPTPFQKFLDTPLMGTCRNVCVTLLLASISAYIFKVQSSFWVPSIQGAPSLNGQTATSYHGPQTEQSCQKFLQIRKKILLQIFSCNNPILHNFLSMLYDDIYSKKHMIRRSYKKIFITKKMPIFYNKGKITKIHTITRFYTILYQGSTMTFIQKTHDSKVT